MNLSALLPVDCGRVDVLIPGVDSRSHAGGHRLDAADFVRAQADGGEEGEAAAQREGNVHRRAPRKSALLTIQRVDWAFGNELEPGLILPLIQV